MVKFIQNNLLKGCFAILVFLFSLPAPAQLKHMTDSISYYMQRKPGLCAEFDGRNTFVSGKPMKISGLRGGLSYGSKIYYYYGLYWMPNLHRDREIINVGQINQDTLTTLLGMRYTAISAEYVFYRTRKWYFSLNSHIGLGSARKQYFKDYGTVAQFQVDNKRVMILPTEMYVTGSYRFIPWFGIGGGIGYRRTLFNSFIKEEDFNGLTYTFGFRIWFNPLCTRIFPKCKYCKYL